MSAYVLMPVKKHVEKTLRAARSIATTAGGVRLVLIVDGDHVLRAALGRPLPREVILETPKTLGFWNSLNYAMAALSIGYDERIIYVGNDVEFEPDWYLQAFNAWRFAFPDGLGLLTFNDERTEGFVAAHGMTTQKWLQVVFGEPFFDSRFFHYYQDSLLTDRSRDLGRFLYAQRSVVRHLHDDRLVYKGGEADKQLKDMMDVEWKEGGRRDAERRLADAIARR